MEKTKIQKTGLRTAGKVFSIIDIVFASLIILGAIAMIVGSIHLNANVLPKIPTGRTEYLHWKTIADNLNYYGIIAAIDGPLMLAFSIVGLQLIKKTDNFAAMLIFGIVNVLIAAPILGILMICIACIECYPKRNKK